MTVIAAPSADRFLPNRTERYCPAYLNAPHALRRWAIGLSAACGLALAVVAPPAQAAFVTTGCANVNVSCTLAELANPLSSININNIVFNNFAGSSFGDLITVTPIDSPTGAALRFAPTNPSINPWRVELGPTTGDSGSFFASIFYSVTSLAGLPINEAYLAASFKAGGSGLLNPSSYVQMEGPTTLKVSCPGAPPPQISTNCVSGTVATSEGFPGVNSAFVETVLFGSVSRLGAPNAFIEVSSAIEAFSVPEPASMAILATGLLSLVGLRRRRR